MSDKKNTKFQPGQSGNPGGRRKGAGNLIRAQLMQAWPEVEPVLLTLAKGGDLQAIRIVAERVCPPMKATEQTIEIDLAGDTLTKRALAVLAALGQGDIAPGQASQLLQGLGALAKIVETDELEQRIEALEARGK